MKTANQFIVFVLIAVLSVSCSKQFGDGKENADNFANKKRVIGYSFSVALPSVEPSEAMLEDLGERGMNMNWGNEAELAVFGKQFVVAKDTMGPVGVADCIGIDYSYYQQGDVLGQQGERMIPVRFRALAHHGVGEEYAQTLNVLYPGTLAKDSEGNPLKVNATEVPVSFTGQDGTLQTIAQNYLVAMGRAKTVFGSGVVSVVDDYADCKVGHDHSAESGHLLLEPKMAIVRVALTVPCEQDLTLLEYISSRSISVGYCFISRITVTDLGGTKLSRMTLSLEDGQMRADTYAQSSLILYSDQYFRNLTDVPKSEAQPMADGTSAWGTMLYLAVPCPEGGILDFEPEINIAVDSRYSQMLGFTSLYAKLKPMTLREGGYYMTETTPLSPRP